MVKVFYNGYPVLRINAWLGGVLFTDGVAEFENIEEGIKFAEMFYLKYEEVEPVAEKKATKKKVKKDE